MNKKEKSLKTKRYEILKPYLNKEKSLKEISEEQNISYSTLKRWASSYKKQGIEGLKKNERKDKNTYRSINEETMDYIKELYTNDPDLKIWDYYKNISSFIKKIGAKSISYDTIYRIINQLDPFVKNHANKNLDKAQVPNDIFELEYKQLDILLLDERDDNLKKPYLNIVYDNFSKAISSFYLSFDKLELEESMILLREAILEKGKYSMSVYGIPKEFIINNLKFNNKERLLEITHKLGVNIKFVPNSDNKLEDFFNDFNFHYLKDLILTLDIDLNFNKLNILLKRYIEKVYNSEKKRNWSQNINNIIQIEDINQLDILLTTYKSKRKIINNEVRFQNLIYTGDNLDNYEKKEITIKYDINDLSVIKAYYKDIFISNLTCETIGNYRLNIYDFLSIKKVLKIKYLNENIGQKVFSYEFKKLIEQKKNESV
jgi:putative transposase